MTDLGMIGVRQVDFCRGYDFYNHVIGPKFYKGLLKLFLFLFLFLFTCFTCVFIFTITLHVQLFLCVDNTEQSSSH